MDIFRAWRHRDFRFLWSTAILGQLGYWFSSITFQWIIAHRTDNDPVALGILYFCTFAPYLLFSLHAGVLADSRDRRKLMVGAQSCGVALAVACATLAIFDALPIPVILVMAFLSGSVTTLVSPTNQALTANVVPAQDLSSAVPMQSAALNLARVTGPALAGPVLIFGGSAGAFAVWLALTSSAAYLASRLRVRAVPDDAVRTESVPARIRAGINHARRRPPALLALCAVAATSVFGSSYVSQLPIIGARVSSDGDTAFLLLVAIGGVGSLGGALTVARRGDKATLAAAAVQLAFLGILVAIIGLTTSYPLVAAIMLIAGGLTFSIMTSVNTILQQVVDDAQRGRVMSLYFVCWGGLLPFGGLGLGLLIRSTSTTWAFIGYGLVALVAGVAIALRGRQTRAKQTP